MKPRMLACRAEDDLWRILRFLREVLTLNGLRDKSLAASGRSRIIVHPSLSLVNLDLRELSQNSPAGMR